MAFKLVVFILVVYLFLTTTLFFVQRKLLYFPATDLPTKQFLQAEGLKYWNKQNNDYYGFISIESQNNAQGTINYSLSWQCWYGR